MLVIHFLKESWYLSVSKRSLRYAEEDHHFDKSFDSVTTKYPRRRRNDLPAETNLYF